MLTINKINNYYSKINNNYSPVKCYLNEIALPNIHPKSYFYIKKIFLETIRR